MRSVIKRFKAEVFPDFLVIDKNALIPIFQLHLNGKISVRDYCTRYTFCKRYTINFTHKKLQKLHI